MLLILAACAGAPKQESMLEQGRLYTTWLLGGRFEPLYARFSPEMQKTFPTVAELASFMGRTAAELGAERGKAAEQVTTLGETRVYTRTAQYERAERPVEVQWTLNQSGQVTGLLIHPVQQDPAAVTADSAAR
jgi:hypothetical protein